MEVSLYCSVTLKDMNKIEFFMKIINNIKLKIWNISFIKTNVFGLLQPEDGQVDQKRFVFIKLIFHIFSLTFLIKLWIIVKVMMDQLKTICSSSSGKC